MFAALADPVMGNLGGLLLYLAVLASSVASLQTTFLPAARAMLAMGAYGAFPKKFAEVHPRFLVPAFSTVVAGVDHRCLLHRGELAVGVHAAGYHCRAGHHDLLVLRHHRIRLRLVLPPRTVRQCAQLRVQVPVPARGRRDAPRACS